MGSEMCIRDRFSNGKILALIDMTELKDKKQELSDIYNHYFEEGGEQHE